MEGGGEVSGTVMPGSRAKESKSQQIVALRCQVSTESAFYFPPRRLRCQSEGGKELAFLPDLTTDSHLRVKTLRGCPAETSPESLERIFIQLLIQMHLGREHPEPVPGSVLVTQQLLVEKTRLKVTLGGVQVQSPCCVTLRK